MLSFYKQYNLAHSVFLTFQSPEKRVHSNHSAKIMDRYKNQFPYHKYETSSEKLFLFTCLYVVYTYTPQSFSQMINHLRNVEKKDVANFVQDIKMYQANLKKDIKFLKENYSDILSKDIILKLYLDDKIKFYTFYFLMLFLGYLDFLKESRIYNVLYRKIKTIFIFLRLKKENILEIKNFIENELKMVLT